MRITLIVLLVTMALLIVGLQAAANSSHTYNITHNVTMEADGEYEFNSNVSTPNQESVTMSFGGVGKAYLSSQMEIYEITIVSSSWMDLF